MFCFDVAGLAGLILIMVVSLNFVVLDWLRCWCFIVLWCYVVVLFRCGYGCGFTFDLRLGLIAVRLVGL